MGKQQGRAPTPATPRHPASLDANAVADYAKRATTQTTTAFILRIIPAGMATRASWA